MFIKNFKKKNLNNNNPQKKKIDILINGSITKENQIFKFSQYIFLCHIIENKIDKWWIQNSIFNI